MPDLKFLKERMERARRLAAALTSSDDRDRLQALADGYQRQIDEASAQDAGPSADAGPSPDAMPSADAAPTTSEAAPSDAASSSDDETPTTSGGGQPETD
jgi:hypothetical protein